MKEVVVFASICFILFLYTYVSVGKRNRRNKFFEDINKIISKLEQNVDSINERVKRSKK